MSTLKPTTHVVIPDTQAKAGVPRCAIEIEISVAVINIKILCVRVSFKARARDEGRTAGIAR